MEDKQIQERNLCHRSPNPSSHTRWTFPTRNARQPGYPNLQPGKFCQQPLPVRQSGNLLTTEDLRERLPTKHFSRKLAHLCEWILTYGFLQDRSVGIHPNAHDAGTRSAVSRWLASHQTSRSHHRLHTDGPECPIHDDYGLKTR